MCKENKLKEFYFKLIHRILVSKKELHLFGVSNNSKGRFTRYDFVAYGRQAYDRPTTWIVSCKSDLQLAYDVVDLS